MLILSSAFNLQPTEREDEGGNLVTLLKSSQAQTKPRAAKITK